jgi:hypothetical protein
MFVLVNCDLRDLLDGLKKQQSCLKLCFGLGEERHKKSHKIFKRTFGDNVMGSKLTFGWFPRFKLGTTSV